MDNNNFNNNPNVFGTPEQSQAPMNGEPQPAPEAQAAPETPVVPEASQMGADAYSQPQGSYDPNANAYSQPQGSYDANMNAYSQPQGNYNANAYAPYNTASTAVVDEMGNPLKNNFVMKLVFSILEILTIFGCNVISCALGVVGLVFNLKANKAYKAGDGEGFKKAKKTSSLMLWIGLGVGILGIIIVILVFVITGNVIKDAAEDLPTPEDYINEGQYDWDDDSDYDYDWDDDTDDDSDVDDFVDQDNDWDDEYEVSDDVKPEEEIIQLNNAEVYNCNGVIVRAQTLTYKTDYDGNIYPVITFEAENTSEGAVDLTLTTLDINGVEVLSYCDYDTINAGKKTIFTVDVEWSDAYKIMNYPKVGYFTVGAYCYGEGEIDDGLYYGTVNISDDYAIYTPDTEQLMYSNAGLEVYYLGCEDGSMLFYAYYIGDSQAVTMSLTDMSINDYMQDDYVYMMLRNGIGRVGRMWLDDDVNADDIQNASGIIKMYDNDTYEDLIPTEEIYFIQ